MRLTLLARFKDWLDRRREARSCREYAVLCGRTHDFAEMCHWFDRADAIMKRKPLPRARSLKP